MKSIKLSITYNSADEVSSLTAIVDGKTIKSTTIDNGFEYIELNTTTAEDDSL